MPTETEVRGLLALMLLHHARAGARTDGAGDLVPLEEQDRTRWERGLIDEGVRLLTGTTTPYQLQAAIAACHDTAASAEKTDWRRIAALYEQLAGLTPSPFVELNRAVAVAMAEGPETGWRSSTPSTFRAGSTVTTCFRPPARTSCVGWADGRRPSPVRRDTLAPTESERRYLRRRIAEIRG